MFAAETCARKKPEVAPENRVGDFFSVSITCAGQNQPEPLEPHQAFSTMDTTTVSGVVYWLSKDPIGIAGGLNLYAFVDNNPVNFIDPSGLCKEEPSWWEKTWDKMKSGAEQAKRFGKNVAKFIGDMAKSGLGMAGEIIGIGQGAATGAKIYYDVSEANTSPQGNQERFREAFGEELYPGDDQGWHDWGK